MKHKELRELIRYSLSNLLARNGQHDFELLAFELARLRVAPNLMQATGPVGAGGDQGRDFESYRTHLEDSLGSGAFVSKASSESIVGACSLQKDAPQKISEDLVKIFSQGQPAALVIYFCEENIPVGKRHALQKACKEKYGARLEIFDGETIANELLAEDTRWIAESYLSISADLLSEPIGDERYAYLRDKWIQRGAAPQNFADFLEIREGLRSSTFDDTAKRDLDEWLKLMRPLALDSSPSTVVQRARYEVIMGTLRGRGSLSPVDEMWQKYFESISENSTPEQLSDAAALFAHSYQAHLLGAASISDEGFRDTCSQLSDLLNGGLAAGYKEPDRATLVQAQVILSPFVSFFAGESSEASFGRLIALLRTWVEYAKSTPFFPTTRLGKMFHIMAEDFGERADFRELNAEVDRLVSEGNAADELADRARERALRHYKKGERLAALDEFHRVRIAWFNHDAMEGSILAMLLLSEIYLDLRLEYAARYYSSGAFFLATLYPDDKIKRLASRAAFQIASSYFGAGEGFRFLYAVSRALEVHSLIATDADNWEKHEHLQQRMVEVAMIRSVVQTLAPDLLEMVDEAIDTFPISPEEITALKRLSETPPWGTMSKKELQDRMRQELGLNPLADVGEQTEILWACLGIHWRIRHGADEHSKLAALELATTLQIVQADLATLDLVIIPSNVDLIVEVGDVGSPRVTPVDQNTECSWTVTMPADISRLDAHESGVYAVAVSLVILSSVSALPSQALEQLVERRFEGGLANRTVAVRPIRELIEVAPLDPAVQVRLAKMSRPIFDPPLTPREGPEMAWTVGPGPNYSLERAKSALEKRYRYFLGSIAITLPTILADERCRELISDLRRQGMLDWQILGLLSAIVMQWQDEFQYGQPKCQSQVTDMRERLGERAFRRERDGDPEFDLATLTKERIETGKFGQSVTVLLGWDLESRRKTPDGVAIKHLLDVRYGNSTDDIEHGEPFPQIGVPEITTRHIIA